MNLLIDNYTRKRIILILTPLFIIVNNILIVNALYNTYK